MAVGSGLLSVGGAASVRAVLIACGISEGAHVAISLRRRRVGNVNVITCGGKIVGGAEADELQQVIDELLPLEPHVVLDLGEVTFLDSAGVGLLVRLLHRTHRELAISSSVACRHVSPKCCALRSWPASSTYTPARTTRSPAFYVRPQPAERQLCSVARSSVSMIRPTRSRTSAVCCERRATGPALRTSRTPPCSSRSPSQSGRHWVQRPRPPGRGRVGAGRSVAILELPEAFASQDPAESSRQLLAQVRVLAGEPA